MVGWHPLSGREFEHAQGDGEGQGGLACCSPLGRRVGDDCATERQRSQGWLGGLLGLMRVKHRVSHISKQ